MLHSRTCATRVRLRLLIRLLLPTLGRPTTPTVMAVCSREEREQPQRMELGLCSAHPCSSAPRWPLVLRVHLSTKHFLNSTSLAAAVLLQHLQQ